MADTYFVDIRVLPDAEHSHSALLGELYDGVHFMLTRLADPGTVGVSFPEYAAQRRSLGAVLRLIGPRRMVVAVATTPELAPIRDCLHLGHVQVVPANTGYRVFRRRQFHTNVERLRRRRMRRHQETAEQAAKAIPAAAADRPDLPCVLLHSRSSGQAFHLFVEAGPVGTTPASGAFNAYGLGGPVSVPWF